MTSTTALVTFPPAKKKKRKKKSFFPYILSTTSPKLIYLMNFLKTEWDSDLPAHSHNIH